MKVVILAGGFGTRLGEETARVPKPMVQIGDRPVLLHIMGIYAGHGFKDFVVACGYKSSVIKDYFHRFSVHSSDFVVDLQSGELDIIRANAPDWRVGLVDTGLHTQTGGRIKRLAPQLCTGTFMVTYGDGLADVDITALLAFHRQHGKLATVTAVHPPARFGGLELDGDMVREFNEKPQTSAGWINGGFFVLEPGALDYIDGDQTMLEVEPLERLARDGELVAYRHKGFWQPMDTPREKQLLETMYLEGQAPWVTQAKS